jgi:hypothetical protein
VFCHHDIAAVSRIEGPGVHRPIVPGQARWDHCCSFPFETLSLGAVGKFGLRIHLLSLDHLPGSAPAFQRQVTEEKSRRDRRHVPLRAVVARSAIYFAVLEPRGLDGRRAWSALAGGETSPDHKLAAILTSGQCPT